MGIPFTGPPAIGAAAVLASQGQLNIVAVLTAAARGSELGLLGFQAGDWRPAAPGTPVAPTEGAEERRHHGERDLQHAGTPRRAGITHLRDSPRWKRL